jgi:protein involved in polysaccharide export with SLBB domain
VNDFDSVVAAIRGRMMQKIVSIGSIVFLLLTGCAAVKNPTPTAYPGIQAATPYTEQEYRLQVGDQLDIKFFYNHELNEQVTVRPDGRISLQLAHEIMVAGLTPMELTELLTKKYASELKKPEITVIVRSFGGQKVYVDGEVAKPGMVPLVGTVTLLQALSQAGGVKDSARTTEVIVIRRGADNQPLVITVNLDKTISGIDMSQDIILRPFDIVYVPKSAIANVNKWVDQYIRRNIPISISTGFGYYP